MKRPKLSICIPTYNRAKFLGPLLESIASQAHPDDVEIAISDNHSEDGTEVLIAEWKKRYSNIIYDRAPKNRGADRNYLNAVEISRGEYCWLMGSDDVVLDDCMPRILSLLGNEDIYLMGRVEADYALNPLRHRVWLEERVRSQVFDFSDKKEILRYLDSCCALGGLFSYLSSIVVRRERWMAHPCPEEFIGTAYSHVYILMRVVLEGCRLYYLTDAPVLCRGGNDSFLTDWVARMLLDFRGYAKLAEALMPVGEMKEAFFSVMHHEYPSINILKTNILTKHNPQQWDEFSRLAQKTFHYPPRIFLLARLIGPTGRLLLNLKRVWRKRIKRKG